MWVVKCSHVRKCLGTKDSSSLSKCLSCQSSKWSGVRGSGLKGFQTRRALQQCAPLSVTVARWRRCLPRPGPALRPDATPRRASFGCAVGPAPREGRARLGRAGPLAQWDPSDWHDGPAPRRRPTDSECAHQPARGWVRGIRHCTLETSLLLTKQASCLPLAGSAFRACQCQ